MSNNSLFRLEPEGGRGDESLSTAGGGNLERDEINRNERAVRGTVATIEVAGRKAPLNAKEYLNQAFRLEQRVQSKLQQIEALRSMASRVTSSVGPDRVVYTRSHTTMEDTVIRILEAEQELNREIDALVDLKQEIKQTIDQVQDVTLRLVLEKRDLCFLKWEQIALEMYYSVRSVQEKHREGIRAVQEILDRRGE